MRISSNSNVTFPCKICNTNIKDTDSATNVTYMSILDSYQT